MPLMEYPQRASTSEGRRRTMKNPIIVARGPSLKGQVALVKVRALMEANLVGRVLIDNRDFLKTLGCTPEAFSIAKYRRTPRVRAFH